MSTVANPPLPPLVIYPARRIHTMDESLPEATAVAVSAGRIVAVGDMASMDPWRAGRTVTVDERLADKVLLPGLIDNHIHPFLGALLMPTEHIAPEAWRQADGSVRPAVRTPEAYRAALAARLAAQPDAGDWFISFGYQPSLHGRWTRPELDAAFGDRPIVLIQRSFHEFYVNSAGLARLGIAEADVAGHPQVHLAAGHFFETGMRLVLGRLMPHFLRPQWYQRGLQMTVDLMHQGGITTAADMLFGGIAPDYELAALDAVLHGGDAPLRVVNVFDGRGFANRASGTAMGPPDQPIDFAAGLAAMQPYLDRAGPRLWFGRAAKLFADGAMFSQLMRMNPPGYTDGHHGEWLMAPEVLAAGVKTFWDAGWQVHVHVNGDGGMDAVLAGLAAAQDARPRFDHRFMLHHVGYHAQAQTARIAALGAHASVNPYFVHALADDYGRLGLGPERAGQIVRAGSLLRAGVRVSFHSDFMMAPTEPLLLAWCAATRRTLSGQVVSPAERLTLPQALRAVTIDAAWALKLDHEIGSIAAGKRADFCVLDDDPFEHGVDGLKDLRVAGTVFEGTPRLLPTSQASSLQTLSSAAGAAANPQRYRPVAGPCGGAADRCDLVRQWSGWLGAWIAGHWPVPAAGAVAAGGRA